MLLKYVILDVQMLDVILDVTVSVTSSRSISVSWDPVIADDRNGIVKGYKVNYQALQMVTLLRRSSKSLKSNRIKDKP